MTYEIHFPKSDCSIAYGLVILWLLSNLSFAIMRFRVILVFMFISIFNRYLVQLPKELSVFLENVNYDD